MGWSESPPFFCAGTETARDITEDLLATPVGSLPHHPLKDLMIPISIWPSDTVVEICTKYLHVMEVYVDDFCTTVQTSDITQFQHTFRALLHTIHNILPPPSISGHIGGNPVSKNKLIEGEGL